MERSPQSVMYDGMITSFVGDKPTAKAAGIYRYILSQKSVVVNKMIFKWLQFYSPWKAKPVVKDWLPETRDCTIIFSDLSIPGNYISQTMYKHTHTGILICGIKIMSNEARFFNFFSTN